MLCVFRDPSTHRRVYEMEAPSVEIAALKLGINREDFQTDEIHTGHHRPFRFQNQELAYGEHWCSIGRENR